MGRRVNKQIAVFLISFIAQMVSICIFSSRVTISGDARIYDNIATNLSSGRGLTENGTTPAPDHIKYGYIIFLAALYKISGHNLLFVKIIQSILVALTCVLVYRIAEKSFSERPAFIAAVVTAAHPAMLVISSHLITESLFIFLSALGILYLSDALKSGSLQKYVVSALFIGLATQVRFVSFFFPFFAALGLFFFYGKKMFALRCGAVLISAAVIISLPWAVRNYIVLGHTNPFVGYGGGGAVWLATYTKGKADQDNPQVRKIGYDITEDLRKKYPEGGLDSPELQIERQRLFFKMAVQNIKDDPLGYVKLFPVKIIRLWVGTYGGLFMIDTTFPEFIRDRRLIKKHFITLCWKLYVLIFSLAVFFFGLLGMAVCLEGWRNYFALYLIVLYTTLLHMALFANTRMGIPALPYMIVFAVYGVFFISKGHKTRLDAGSLRL